MSLTVNDECARTPELRFAPIGFGEGLSARLIERAAERAGAGRSSWRCPTRRERTVG